MSCPTTTGPPDVRVSATIKNPRDGVRSNERVPLRSLAWSSCRRSVYQAMAALKPTMQSTSSVAAARTVSSREKSMALCRPWRAEPTICGLIEACGKFHFHGVFWKEIQRADLRLRDEGQVAGKGMNGGRHEYHQEG